MRIATRAASERAEAGRHPAPLWRVSRSKPDRARRAPLPGWTPRALKAARRGTVPVIAAHIRAIVPAAHVESRDVLAGREGRIGPRAHRAAVEVHVAGRRLARRKNGRILKGTESLAGLRASGVG